MITCNCLELLDHALELGKKELALLARGEVQEAQDVAKKRNQLLNEVHKNLPQHTTAHMQERLEQLSNQQQTASSYATDLHEKLHHRLKETQQESRRVAGYANVRKVERKTRGSRYVNRRS